MQIYYAIPALALLAASAASADEQCTAGKKITAEEINAAQEAWAEGIVAIGKASDPKKVAGEHIDKLYAYNMGPVLFKPTKASEMQFRDDKQEALSYFVGGDVKEDSGFALAPFTQVRFENHSTFIDCDSALAQGNYFFTPKDGNEIKVEYSLGYVRDADGKLKINLQHSSLPYKPD